MKPLPAEKWAEFLNSKPETGMGYQTGNITLKDGRVFVDVIINSGYVTKIRGRTDIPFEVHEIEKIEITGNRWDWKE